LENKDEMKTQELPFYTDLLVQEITSWKGLGSHVVIGLDANKDIWYGDTAKIFRDVDMHKIVLKTHRHKSPPATCNKNKSREPIDSFFVTLGLRSASCGYSAFNSGCTSDHHYLWVDIPDQDSFWYAAPPMVPPAAQRLHCKDLQMVKRYNTKVKLELNHSGLLDALSQLQEKAKQQGWSPEAECEYNWINKTQ
jgi:hypothetical protein